ncbi:hypothetical protein [Umezawaea sp. Da 62-37]|uniref:hypothetical protein n=1 Tax=Umezawaea sp. Da 62-37 TaxID=3075927 RepID=UPI0028F703C4|nr:hypothetical protein [Umezawaea sp. Da 62-37]WNV81922.1 hypothetical protein RM788_27285 [Umezawaea sp. Da 62-37]
MTSPRPVDGERRSPAEVFLGAVRSRIRQSGLVVPEVARDCRQPVQVVRDAVQGQVGEWPLYRRILEVCGADKAAVAQFHGAWKRARPGSPPSNVVSISSRAHQAVDGGQPAVPVEDGELRAATPREFIAVLRLVQIRSGFTPAQIAIRSNIPRSTAYRFVDNKKNTALPTKADQVKAFLVGCRLPENQVRRVVLLWTDLREAESEKRSSIGAEALDPLVGEGVDATPDRSGSAADSLQWLADEIVGRSNGRASSPAEFLRWGLAVVYVLVTTALAAALVISTSGWAAGTQVLAIMLVCVLSAGLAASWCTNVGRWTARGSRRGSATEDAGLVIESPGAAPAVIGLEERQG